MMALKERAKTKKLTGNRGAGVGCWRDVLFRPTQLVGFKKQIKGYPTPIPSDHTEFFVLNPLHDLTRALDANVASFQNILIELDKRGLQSQEKYVEQVIGMPYTMKTYSGGKSIHYIISLDTPVTLTEWRDMVSFLLFVVKDADAQCKNPARLTRTPNALREGLYKQTLLHCEPAPMPTETFKAFLNSDLMLAQRLAYNIKAEHEQAIREQQRALIKESGEPPRWVAELLADPIKKATNGSRHATMVSVAVTLYSLGFNLESYIEPRLLDLASALDKSEQEVYSILNWVERNVQSGSN